MFGELPKLLDRNFAIGFFLPAALIAALLWATLGAFGLAPPVAGIGGVDGLLGTAVAVGIVWLLSILLMAVNYPLLRILQGYGDWNPLRLRERRLRRRFEAGPLRTFERQAALDAARAAGTMLPTMPATHAADLRRAVELYPDDAGWVLGTGFGNRMRAAEVYARAVYGLDTVPAWPRLQALLSPEFRELINAAKAQLDFCVNLVGGGLLVAAGFAGLALYRWQLPAWWPPAAAAFMVLLGYALAVQSVKQYGLHVRSAFDLYRGALAEQLGLAMPRRPDKEREMWLNVSRMFIYRSVPRFLNLAEFRTDADATPAPGDEQAASHRPLAPAIGLEPTRDSLVARLARTLAAVPAAAWRLVRRRR